MPIERVYEGSIRAYAKTTAVVNVPYIKELIREAVARGVNETIEDAFEQAQRDVPVRKVFKYGRKNVGSKAFAEQRIAGRQETRPLSLEEALSESLLRRRLGLPSAFPQSRSGRRIVGTQSLVRTTDFGSYRSKNRANLATARGQGDLLSTRRTIARIDGVNRIVDRVPIIERVPNRRTGGFDEREIGFRFETRPDIEADLSSRGRAELRRATGETLGGALKRSLERDLVSAKQSNMKGGVSAGNDEVDYAKYVEFGTRRSRAQPFLRPALAQAKLDLESNVVKELRGIKG